jgi:hypothetical protein
VNADPDPALKINADPDIGEKNLKKNADPYPGDQSSLLGISNKMV